MVVAMGVGEEGRFRTHYEGHFRDLGMDCMRRVEKERSQEPALMSGPELQRGWWSRWRTWG